MIWRGAANRLSFALVTPSISSIAPDDGIGLLHSGRMRKLEMAGHMRGISA